MKTELKTIRKYSRPECEMLELELDEQVLQASNGSYDVSNPFGRDSEEEEI